MGLVAVSYDPVAVLNGFASAHGIGFPLLSDEGSRVITELGLLDRDLETHHAAFNIETKQHQWGVAYPAVFVIDGAGKVVSKRIHENYRAREGARLLLEDTLGIASEASGTCRRASAPKIRAAAFSDFDSYVRWQKSRLHVELEIEPGWHVYGRGSAADYTILTIEVEPAQGLVVGEPAYPDTVRLVVAGLDEVSMVHEGHVRVEVPIAVNLPPGHGEVVIRARLLYQACNDSECLPPAQLVLEVPLQETPPA